MASSKKQTSADQKVIIERVIADCEAVVTSYVGKWKPFNEQWPTVEGCAYLRLSSDQQVAVEKGSLEQQVNIAISEVSIRSNSDQMNYKITNFYIEPGLTGRNDDRPQFSKMKRAIRKKKHKFVVFKEIARIARDGRIWREFFELCIDNDAEIFIRGLPINPNDPAQIFQLGLMASFAEYESNQISKRTRESNFSAMVSSGKFNGTKPVLGLDQLVINNDAKVGFYTPNSSELKTVEWIMRSFVKYASFQKTLEECERLGIKNKNGEPFSKHSLNTLLANTKYIGKWQLNADKKDKDQRKLMAYDRYEAVDLPHGCVVDGELFKRVQETAEELGGNKRKNTRLTRVYLLSGLLQYEDGSSFGGSSAQGENNEERTNYYFNKLNRIRIPVEVIEDETKETVAQILKNSPELQNAIKTRCKKMDGLKDLLVVQAKKLEGEIRGHQDTMARLNMRLDFLLEGDKQQAEAFRQEYVLKSNELKAKIKQCQDELALIGVKREELADSDFDWRQLGDKAQRIQNLIQERDPVALKRAYQHLFKAIVIGSPDKDGIRPVKHVLRNEDEDTDLFPDPPKGSKNGSVNLTENYSVDGRMAPQDGLEPPTR